MKTETGGIPPLPTAPKPAPAAQVSELVDLKRTVGEIITARILFVTVKSEQQTTKTTQEALHNITRSANTRLSPEARAAQLFNVNQQLVNANQQLATTNSSSAGTAIGTLSVNATEQYQSLRLFQLALEVIATGKQLVTELQAHQLPADWLAGKVLTLQVQPQTGLKVLADIPTMDAKLDAALRPVMQALSKWLPLQNDLRSSLATVAAATELAPVQAPTSASAGVQPQPLPENLRQVLHQLISNLPRQEQVTQPAELKQAISQSGTALETSLLRGTDGRTTSAGNPPSALPPGTGPEARSLENLLQQIAPGDLKSLLIVTLSTMITQLQQSPAGSPLPQNWESLVNWLTQQVATFAAGTAAHPLTFPSNSSHSSQTPLNTALDAGEILRALAQSLARIQVNQLNAVHHNLTANADGTNTQVWFVELPIQGQRLDSVQLRLEKECAREEKKKQQSARWKLILAFDLESVGPFQSHVLYTDGTVSATFWAAQQNTLRLVTSELPKLRKGLVDWGLQVGDLTVRKGTPPPPQSPLSRQLIDERA